MIPSGVIVASRGRGNFRKLISGQRVVRTGAGKLGLKTTIAVMKALGIELTAKVHA